MKFPKNFKSQFIIALAFVLCLFSITYAGSFTVGVEKSNAKPVALVDEDGTSISASNPMAVAAASPEVTTISDGIKNITTGGTAETIASVSTVCISATITARESNTDVIVIGGSTVVGAEVTRRGTPLLPFSSYSCKNCDLQDFYADVVVNGEGVTFICEQ